MVQGCRGPGFPQEPLFGLGTAGELDWEELQGYGTAKMSILGLEDDPHTAPADFALDLIFSGKKAPRLKDFTLGVKAQCRRKNRAVHTGEPTAAGTAEGLAIRVFRVTAGASRHRFPQAMSL
jgi:hypothetical protein